MAVYRKRLISVESPVDSTNNDDDDDDNEYEDEDEDEDDDVKDKDNVNDNHDSNDNSTDTITPIETISDTKNQKDDTNALYQWVINAEAGNKLLFHAGPTRRTNLNKLTEDLVANNPGLNLSSKNPGGRRAVTHTIEMVSKPSTVLSIPQDYRGSKTERWGKSEAREYAIKQLMKKDSWMSAEIIFGNFHGIPWTHTANDIWKEEPMFQKYNLDRFTDNLKRLHRSIQNFFELSDWDQAALNKEKLIYPVDIMLKRGYPRWNTSRAKELLEKDVNEQKHVGILPRELRLTRQEFKEFPLDVFRDRLYAVIRKDRSDVFWIHKRNRGMMKKHIETEDKINEQTV